MSSPTLQQLLAITEAGDIDSEEFIARLAGLFRHCQNIDRKAANLLRTMSQRVESIRWHTFVGLAEIGEALLRVQEQRPQGFAEWFAAHQDALGFKMRHADRCKRAAKAVRDLGLEAAYTAALQEAERQRETLPTIRVPSDPSAVDGMSLDRALELHEKLDPIWRAISEKISTARALAA